jgi:hypothetical protein
MGLTSWSYIAHADASHIDASIYIYIYIYIRSQPCIMMRERESVFTSSALLPVRTAHNGLYCFYMFVLYLYIVFTNMRCIPCKHVYAHVKHAHIYTYTAAHVTK